MKSHRIVTRPHRRPSFLKRFGAYLVLVALVVVTIVTVLAPPAAVAAPVVEDESARRSNPRPRPATSMAMRLGNALTPLPQ